MSPRIILGSIGSLGDLHPVIGLGRALATQGADPVLAVRADHLERVRDAGLSGRAIFDDIETVASEMGLTPADLHRKVLEDDRMFLRDFILPRLADTTRRLAEVANGVDLIACSRQTIAGQIVAQAQDISYVPLEFQPIMLSRFDPPRGSGFDLARPDPGRIGLVWNTIFFWLVRRVMHRDFGPPIDKVRAEWGLGPQASVPFFEDDAESPFRLALFSPLLTRFSEEEQADIRFCGFPCFDGTKEEKEVIEERDRELAAFLNDGPAPIAISLASFSFAEERLYTESIKAVRSLGKHAILMTGGTDVGELGERDDVLLRHYVPFSLLFPKCAAVVHHGGIGTIAMALHAGIPQLIVPIGADQPDNAARTVRLGVGLSISEKRYTSQRAANLLSRLLDGAEYREAARDIAEKVAGEPGPEEAARLLLSVVQMKAQESISEKQNIGVK